MQRTHQYKTTINWTGNKGSGTETYAGYSRNHSVSVENKTVIQGSSDPAFRGDPHLHNPEELFLSALSSCHMLWFLHICSTEGVVVITYTDYAEGTLQEYADGSGKFSNVLLKPTVKVKTERMAEKVTSIHQKANQKCFIANSCNVTIAHEPITTWEIST